jgi:hypothetical protein
MLRITVVFFVAAYAALAASACGGDDDNGRPVTPASPTSSSRTPNNSSDIPPIVDDVTEAVISGDPARLEALFEYQSIACIEGTPSGPGGPPLCQGDEENGSLVDVLFQVACEKYYIRRVDMDAQRFITNAVATDTELYAAFEYSQPATEGPSYGANARFLLVFSRPEPNPLAGSGTGYAIGASDTGVLGISYGCGSTPQELADDPNIGRAIIEPE